MLKILLKILPFILHEGFDLLKTALEKRNLKKNQDEQVKKDY
jgi:hypothetical protein